MFKIANGENYSLEEIHTHQQNGGSVLRSAHVGNFNPSTLFLAQEGFPIILHEHIRGNAKIYKPAYLKIDGHEFPITDQTTLPLTHSVINEEANDEIHQIMRGSFQRPAQVHYESLKKLFPNNVQLTSQLFFEQNTFFQEVLEVLSKRFSHLFSNFVDKNGNVFNLAENQSGNYQEYISEDGQQIRIDREQIGELTYNYLRQTIDAIVGSGENPEGIVMKSNLYVLLSSLCEIYKGRNGVERYHPDNVEVVHFSGAEMINYLVKNQKQVEQNAKELNDLYVVVKKEFEGLLPNTLDFRLVPTGMIGRIITDKDEVSKKIDDLFVANQSLTESYGNRQESRGLSADEIRQQVLSLDDQAVSQRVLELYDRIGDLPGRIKKKISDVKVMLEDFESYREKIIGTLISTEIAIKDTYSESGALDKEITRIRGRISEISTEIQKTELSEVSQYDVLEHNTKFYFPKSARELSQRQLQDIWNYSVRESSKELKQEIEIPKNGESNSEFKPKLK